MFNCPTVHTFHHVDLSQFTQHTWYSQMQQEVEYQKRDSFYCVTATYNIEPNRTVPLFKGNVISVYNYANHGSVNGPPTNTKDGTVLCAKQVFPKDTSKLVVSPCNVIGPFGGPYWIVGVGMDYSWLVVSGGQPKQAYENGCTTQINATNNAGLWIFSRYPVIPPKDLYHAKYRLKELGYTLDFLLPVEQNGCSYKNAFIKTI